MYIKLLLVSIIICTSNCFLSVDKSTTFLKDDNGRYRFFHGINVVVKQFPFYPSTDKFNPFDSLVDEDFDNLQKWGFNAIRLFIAWEGFQKIQNQFNYTYLEQIQKIIRKAKDYNIDILLDAHQDLYTRQFCGEGFPTWLTKPTNFPHPLKVNLTKDENGFPLKSSCKQQAFFKYYLTDDVNQFQQEFFSNKRGMVDKFIRMWSKVVSYFRPQTNILGYDLINEPSGGNLRKKPYMTIGPYMNNNHYLLPFYRKLAQSIRSQDQDRLIFFQPCVGDYLGGFTGSPTSSSKDVLSYHTYCPLTDQKTNKKIQQCKLINTLYFNQRMKNVKELKIGSMMTQFGSVFEEQYDITELSNVLKLSDKHWQSWFYWQYKYNHDSTSSQDPSWHAGLFYPNGTLQMKKISTLSYAYLSAVCGQPIAQQNTQYGFRFSFTPRICSKNTEIYLDLDNPKYSKGFQVSFNPSCPQCRLQMLQSKYNYEIILASNYYPSKVQVNIAGYI